MPKSSPKYVCQACGAVYAKWAGKCSECGEWNSIAEEASAATYSNVTSISKSKTGRKAEANKIKFADLSRKTSELDRQKTSIQELDRVLGGGLVPGSAILLGGDPGIGKSTILLQLAAQIAVQQKVCVYITGEESVEQVKIRSDRLGLSSQLSEAPIAIATATSVVDIINNLKESKPAVVIIDSIQTMFLEAVGSAPGTVTQVRSCAYELINFAKSSGAALVLVGHVTKDGQIAGPKVLEHMVDTVLYFEGDKGNQYRILRSVKNRYGPANEIGVFEMTGQGLQEVKNPSSLFLSESQEAVSGSAIFVGVEGTRPILAEIQALVSPSNMATPRRTVVGWDINRLAMILAVLQTRCGMQLYDKEVYLNIAGGLRVNDPAADLAVAAAISSSLSNLPIPRDIVFFGEVALSGEIRKVGHTNVRIKEAQKLGFKKAIAVFGNLQNNHFILESINHIRDLRSLI